MKQATKQVLAVLIALALTVTLVTVMAVNTSAASGGFPVGTNHCVEFPSSTVEGDTNHCVEFPSSDVQGDTNHCVEDYSTSYPYTVPEGIMTNPDGSPRYEDVSTQEPTFEEPTTYEDEYLPTLELFCFLEILQPDGSIRKPSFTQRTPGYSPTFNGDVSDFAVSDKPYTATVETYSAIYPDELVFTDSVTFYVRREGNVHFSCYAPGGSLTVSGSGIEIVPDVTYPTTLPDWTTTAPTIITTPPSVPYETVWTTGSGVTYPSSSVQGETVWTSSPAATDASETTEQPHYGTFGIGDVDMNGTINIADATLIQQIAAEKLSPSSAAILLADTDGDGQITVLDATCVQKYAAEYKDGTGQIGTATINVAP